METSGTFTYRETITQGQLGRLVSCTLCDVLTEPCLQHLACCIREPRGLGFVEFTNAKDAEDAKYALDRSPMAGREVLESSSIAFVECIAILKPHGHPDIQAGPVMQTKVF